MHDNYCLAIIISGNSIPETVSKSHKLSYIQSDIRNNAKSE